MKVIESDSNAHPAEIAFVQAAIDLLMVAYPERLVSPPYSDGDLLPVPPIEQLTRVCRSAYPDMETYQGDTHVRLLLTGDSHGRSIYIDLSEE